jgi:signal transduction histidine kinase/ligand-binding sensor domain-containing protein
MVMGLLLGRGLAASPGMPGAAPPILPASYSHAVWQSREGLPHNSVETILQTRDGYLWIGTANGLARFDGVAFKVHDSRSVPALRAAHVRALFEDRAGVLWIGLMRQGLVRYQAGKFFQEEWVPGLGNMSLRCIYEDREGTYWIGTEAGLIRRTTNETRLFRTEHGLAHGSIYGICEDAAGAIWIATENGLSAWSDGRFRNFKTREGLPDNSIRTMVSARDGGLWLGTMSGGGRWENGLFTPLPSPGGRLRQLLEDPAGTLWIATAADLNRYAGGQWTALPDEFGPNLINALCHDREGNLWIGTHTSGLHRLGAGKFTTYGTREGLAHDITSCALEARDGSVWIGTFEGLSQWRDGRVVRTIRDDPPHNEVWSLCEDAEGGIWAGTPAAGVTRYLGGTKTRFNTPNGLLHRSVASLHADRAGNVWIGTGYGLNQWRDGKVTSFKYAEPGDGRFEVVYCIHEDHAGILWLATARGLCRVDDGKIQNPKLIEGAAFCLYEEPPGTLWVGTAEKGLCRLRDGKTDFVQTRNGLADNCIFQILPDGRSNLWMSCRSGVFRVSQRDLEAVAGGSARSLECTQYGVADGMRTAECQGKTQPAGCRTRDGRLWFPTLNGITVVDAAHLPVNEKPPPVILENVVVASQPVSLQERLQLAPGARQIEFHYTGLNFSAPERLVFKYKLEGFDPDWTAAGGRRVAYYNQLPPGQYSFRVIAANSDGVWNREGATFAVVQAPFFHQTAAFYLLCLATGAGLIWWTYRWRIRQIQDRHAAVLAERSRIARDIHDTLAQGFTGISIQLEAVKDSLPAAEPAGRAHLELAQSLVRSSLAEARRSIWELRHPGNDAPDLVGDLARVARQLSEETAVTIAVRGTAPALPEFIGRNLFRIGQEAMTNAVRHARATTITVEVGEAAGRFVLKIQDDGRGFDTAQAGSGGGFGLRGMQERAQQIEAQLTFNSRPGATIIQVTVPLKTAGANGAPHSP